ncbi:hypothetical protein A3C17_02325 [Candidatus Uhrbacteria bacterium RIFCSPHIGHO2_02_FULL_53_13]|uniref:Uncharacterized protein n=2 Tax=Candidatus Uhriibacteriota TaxID=1752732 RepID=A0A1F7TZC4_9BACT|nr:MAG: hypothetical protein A3C17_02325 [Candidatus Uhrbacteria bacterium RIFCSPHIGHO2_02_FULL_53_13]OGL88993.1 MAG: hypothetical protein A3I45_01560 [Candidatus Uhrbacteria bacterium RIFCSPLOWO2_02_FULL_53_10]
MPASTNISALVTTVASDFISASPATDIFVLIGAAAAVLLLGFWGRSKLISVTIASYAAIAMLATLPIFDWVFGSLGLPFSVWSVIVTVLALVLILHSMIYFSLGDVLEEDPGFIASSIVLAIAVIGLLFSYSFTVVPADVLTDISPVLAIALTGAIAKLLWFLAPIVVIGATKD